MLPVKWNGSEWRFRFSLVGPPLQESTPRLKIAPVYSGPVVQVLDASRSVPIAGNLLNPQRGAFTEELKAEQAQMRKNHEERGAAATFLTLDEARANRLATDWSKSVVPAPLNPGVTVLEGVTIAALRPYIDWTPFFLTWEMHGRYPNIFDDPKVGAEAKTLFNDAEALLNRIENEQLLGVRGVAGLFPANSTGDDIEVYGDESRTAPLCTLHTLRQQKPQPEGKPNLALSDFIAPKRERRQRLYRGICPHRRTPHPEHTRHIPERARRLPPHHGPGTC